jgi:dipeptidyl aminopeptidase/acylaminoacyl peptidase
MLVSLADSPVYPRSFDLWEIRTDAQTGQASSSPRRVSNWAGSTLADLSATADGKRLAYLEGTAQYDVYTAEIEGSGFRLNPPQRLTLDDSLDIPQVWTPDGREILFTSDRNGSLDTFKQAVDQKTAEAVLTGPEDQCDARLSPDGAWILYFDQPIHSRISSTEPVTLRRVPFSGGPPQVALKERGFCCVHCNDSKAKAQLCVVDKRVGNELRFYAFDPVQGMGRELTRIHSPILHDWQISPDGSSIAMATPERGGGIRILSLTGKPERIILVNEALDHVLWSADGRGFYATTVDTNMVPWAIAGGSFQKILYIDLDGRSRALWQSVNFSGVYGLPSPDGRYLALGMGRMVSNAWMLENF